MKILMVYIEIIFRTTIAFTLLYILCRLLGKKLISQMTFFDFVAGITLGSITANIMFSKDINLSVGIFGLLTFALLVLFADVTVLKSLRGRKILNGEPTVLVRNGRLLEQGMKKTRFTVDELLHQLRKKDIFYLDQVEVAILETDGTISVLRFPAHLPTTQKDISNIQESRGLAQAIIIDGKILQNSLKGIGKNEGWLRQILKSYHISDVKDVLYAEIDEQGNVYVDTKQDFIRINP